MAKVKKSLEEITREFLLDMGVPAHLKGYLYLTEVIATAAKARNVLKVKCKELYCQVATSDGSDTSSVENAIRQAIDATWDLDDSGSLSMYFGYGNNPTERPGNEEFIIFVADRVQMLKKCQ